MTMNINRVSIAGFTGKEAWSRTAPNGKSVTRLSVATTKRYKDAEGNWREKTQWHMCVAYGPTAEHAVNIQTGTHVFIEGELIYRECDRTIETESGPVKVPWPVTEIVVESLSVLDRPQKQERKGAA
jgi:single-strand DNA-binding protein